MTNDVRKEVETMKKKVRLTIRIPEELDARLEQMCNQMGISKNALITKILWEYMKKKK